MGEGLCFLFLIPEKQQLFHNMCICAHRTLMYIQNPKLLTNIYEKLLKWKIKVPKKENREFIDPYYIKQILVMLLKIPEMLQLIT